MTKPINIVKNRIMTYFLILVTITICAFSLYVINTFKNYGDKVIVDLLFFHARQFENILYNRWTNTNDTNRLALLVESMDSRTYNIRTEVIDKNGNVLAVSRGAISNKNQLEFPEIKRALQGLDTFFIYAKPDEQRIEGSFAPSFFVAVPLRSQPPGQYVVRVSATGEIFAEDLRGMIFNTFLAFLAVMGIAILISTWLSRATLKPLEEITKVAKKLSQGNLNEKVTYTGENEFGLLAHTLNNLSSSLSLKIKELSAEKQKQEMILEQMDNIVILVDRTGKVASINHRGRYVFHNNRNTCSIGLHNFELIGSSLLDATIKECFETLSSKIIDLQLTRNGVKYVFQIYASPLVALNEYEPETVLLVFHDITALLNVYERQTEFIANASHELATPLTSIKGFSETLLDGALQSPELSEKFVRIIYEESDHMQKLVSDLLQLSRLDSLEYRQTITLSAFSSDGILENIKERLLQHIEKKQLAVEIIYKKEPQEIYANPDWFKQALINLTENAIKYSLDGGKITLTYNHDDEFAIFSIKDEGLGISAENLPFIFERFYRADKARAKNKIGGTGIGLSIVKFVVELFGGTISVESRVNAGSSFTVTVPLAKDEQLEQ